MRNSWSMEQLQQKLKLAAMTEKDPERRKLLWYLHYLSLDAKAEYEDIIREAEMIGVRNPAFEGDYVGWLDDDFEDRPQLSGDVSQQQPDETSGEDHHDKQQQDESDDDKNS